MCIGWSVGKSLWIITKDATSNGKQDESFVSPGQYSTIVVKEDSWLTGEFQCVSVMCHPSYSQGLSPTNFHLSVIRDNAKKYWNTAKESDVKEKMSRFFGPRTNDFKKQLNESDWMWFFIFWLINSFWMIIFIWKTSKNFLGAWKLLLLIIYKV